MCAAADVPGGASCTAAAWSAHAASHDPSEGALPAWFVHPGEAASKALSCDPSCSPWGTPACFDCPWQDMQHWTPAQRWYERVGEVCEDGYNAAGDWCSTEKQYYSVDCGRVEHAIKYGRTSRGRDCYQVPNSAERSQRCIRS